MEPQGEAEAEKSQVLLEPVYKLAAGRRSPGGRSFYICTVRTWTAAFLDMCHYSPARVQRRFLPGEDSETRFRSLV
ncbi:unnamed protein product [Staurois parvus]|uniref:Uncharacterized protein n=1 Tax=Staurois parvus TaxID=386267 RepID=A0ABN9A7F9_9NEOB|nr:unnamed protein product [Staurois parvus]